MNYEYWSNVAMVSAWVVYLVAMVMHAAEWALARGLGTRRVVRRSRQLITVGGAPSAETPGDDEPAPDPAAIERFDRFGRIGFAFTVIGFLCNAVGVVLRGAAADRFPWGNMYEFLTTATAFVMAAYVIGGAKFGMRWLGLFATLTATVTVGLAVEVFYVEVAPLVPALHSVWFVIHIVTAVIGTAGFTLGGLVTILYLVKKRAEDRGAVSGYLQRVPTADRLDLFAYRLHAFAFPLWTFTLAAGAIWAEYAWGRYWGWDPKETWTLITWFIYAAYLHARTTAGWKGGRAGIIALVGVVSLWFNFIGVNMLFSGLHSYAGI